MSSEDENGGRKVVKNSSRECLRDVTNTSTPKRPRSSDHDLKCAIGETNKLLNAVLERMDKQEKKIEHIEKKLNTSISSSSSSTPIRNRRKEVPIQVRVSLHLE